MSSILIGRILRMVLLRGFRPILVGIVIGLAANFAFTRLMAIQLHGVSATDPWTLLAVNVILGPSAWPPVFFRRAQPRRLTLWSRSATNEVLP